MKQIACIIVTFNRRSLLSQCIDHVLTQTFKPTVVYIVDNASSDGTYDMVISKYHLDNHSCSAFVDGVEIRYVRLKENIGGAGGFYTGMKAAYDHGGFGGYWVMDDDGMPEAQCLEELVKHLRTHDYLSPMVVDVENPDKMSFEYCGEKQAFLARAHDGIVEGVACPFNGILYSQRLVEKVGFPKKEMFIWGDEENYSLRCQHTGFHPVTVVTAVHRHPANRVQTDTSIFGKVDVAPQMWRCYCRYRNAMYNWRSEMSFLGKLFVCFNHVWYYLVKKHSVKWTLMYLHAFRDGLKGDFTQLDKYKFQ